MPKKSAKQQQLEFHPFACAFPMFGPDALQELANDIKDNGLREPITRYQNKILDGRNRYLASQTAGVEPVFVEFEGDDAQAIAFVISRNLRRRHLDESQRAMAAATLANMRQGRPGNDATLQVSRKAAAAALAVSERSVASAAAVREHGTPELVAAVEAGDLPVSTAADLARATAEVQRELVETLSRYDDGKMMTPKAKRIAKARIKHMAAALAKAGGPDEAEPQSPSSEGESFPVHFGSCHGGRVSTVRTRSKAKASTKKSAANGAPAGAAPPRPPIMPKGPASIVNLDATPSRTPVEPEQIDLAATSSPTPKMEQTDLAADPNFSLIEVLRQIGRPLRELEAHVREMAALIERGQFEANIPIGLQLQSIGDQLHHTAKTMLRTAARWRGAAQSAPQSLDATPPGSAARPDHRLPEAHRQSSQRDD